MRIRGSVLAPLLIVGLAVAPSLQAAPVRACESLTALKLSHASIVSAKTLKAGPTTMTTFMGPMTLDVPTRCEVRGISRPSSDSEISASECVTRLCNRWRSPSLARAESAN